jgi:hypothetical protein
MPIDLDMVIDVDASAFPLGVFIRLWGQRTQGRAIE